MANDGEGLARGINLLSKITSMREAVHYINVCHPQGLIKDQTRAFPLHPLQSPPNLPQQPFRSPKPRIPPLQLRANGASKVSKSLTSRERVQEEEAEEWFSNMRGISLPLSSSRFFSSTPASFLHYLPAEFLKRKGREVKVGTELRQSLRHNHTAEGQATSKTLIREDLELECLSAVTGMKFLQDCGYRHAILVEADGKVSAFGDNSMGILPMPELTFYEQPVDISHYFPAAAELQIRQVACGGFHTLMLSEDGRIFVFGSNCFGQLGLGLHAGSTVSQPAQVALSSELQRYE
ncbi:hypothetical protein GUITHDRAFT_145837 [Guillardia theta CCMP2712]|uniref:Uncharacterized protein n=1 Tax=Guillardia theta (strain CCMP2712) TaxID=905079 RepID=L1IKE2_GUITC|nr:hypothetical protein GUITHDRAFT_145837 [Guillardia theta CCMP2712]EKX36384.1 hypothetical protein GUITHDRAFT_145837 [Guillardia theta CCMP2712]|eukprot:XP_005823364.1 hypothetical protein GUITHDRAFT_145837 [Guillardia theta CCMP2712]